MNINKIINLIKMNIENYRIDNELIISEIGDGNLNYVYRIADICDNRSMIIKVAEKEARLSNLKPLPLKRNKLEADYIMLQKKLVPGYFPEIYYVDRNNSFFCMEDLASYKLLREELLHHNIYPNLADQLAEYLSNTLVKTSDLCMSHQDKKRLVSEFINPDLCEITEELVFTEPYHNINHRNIIDRDNQKFVEKELYMDSQLHFEIAKFKSYFMTNAQALLHGDLHSGSIFISETSLKVIDCEFAFYGPMGYDIGNVIAHVIFSWCNACVMMEESQKRRGYLSWLEDVISNTIDLFIIKAIKICQQHLSDSMIKMAGPEYLEYYFHKVIEDTAVFTGTELIRRIVGIAKVKDITDIQNPLLRRKVERFCVLCAKEFIMNHSSFHRGEDFVKIMQVNQSILYN